jgi:hypothetical protein
MRGKGQKGEKRTMSPDAGQAFDIKRVGNGIFFIFDERTEQIFGRPWKMHKRCALAKAPAEVVK